MFSDSYNRKSQNTIDHLATQGLSKDRVGFSIINLTGQSLRYLQFWDETKTVQYLQVGLLFLFLL